MEVEGAGDVVAPPVLHVDDDGNGPDENVRIPDGRHAEILVRLDLHPDRAVRAFIADRGEPPALGQAEKGPLHCLALIAQGQIGDGMDEQIELRIDEALDGHGLTWRSGAGPCSGREG